LILFEGFKVTLAKSYLQTMKPFRNLNSILQKDWQHIEVRNLSQEFSLFNIESRYSSAGILIWHILEDRIFISEGFCKMNNMSKAEMFNFEGKMKNYLMDILDKISASENFDTTFKTKMPGIEKEFFCSVQLFDREEIGILDLMLICWEDKSQD
jgi:hypothetical protein